MKDKEVALLLLNCIQRKDKQLEELKGNNKNMEEQMDTLRVQVTGIGNYIEDFEQQISTQKQSACKYYQNTYR